MERWNYNNASSRGTNYTGMGRWNYNNGWSRGSNYTGMERWNNNTEYGSWNGYSRNTKYQRKNWSGANGNYNYHPYRKTASKSPPVICYDCQEQFASKKLLWSHKDKAHPKRSFYCEICNKQFSTFGALKEHGKSHPIYACKECPETFRFENSYLAHMDHAHRTESIAVSDIADKSTNVVYSKGSLLKTIICSFKNPIASSTPSCSFNKESPDITPNSSVDSGVDIKPLKPFQCSRCIKSFDTISSLTTHAKIHTLDETPSSILDNQISVKTEIGGNQFCCPYCIKTFDARRDLHFHMNSVHTVLFYCAKCPAEFKFEAELKAHAKVHN